MNMRALHRMLAWIAGLVAILWAATGFLHPIMSWTAPCPEVQAPPKQALVLEGLTPPGPALSALGLRETRLVRLVMVDAKPFWFAAREGAPRVVLDAATGAIAPEAERGHAIALARHYAALPNVEIAGARLVTAFSTSYPSVNRLLPVWEVRFATPDGLTLYVDTGLDRLAAVTNDQRRMLLAVFQNVHTLKFLEPIEPLRLALISVLIVTVLATTAFGAAMLLRARGRGLRRAHALLAWAALPLVVAFTLSGLLHLIVTSRLWAEPAPQGQTFAVARLAPTPGLAPNLTARELIATGDSAPLWRLQVDEAAFYLGADPPSTDADRARALAGASADARTASVTGFGDGYGFLNKRLPVWRVETAAGPVFADVREGLIAARPRESWLTRLEGWTFDHLHKWDFLTPFGRRNRDYATMAATAIILAAAGCGLALAPRRRKGARGRRAKVHENLIVP